MSHKGIKLFVLFIISISFTMAFQNCGKSSAKKSSSDNGGLQVEVVPNGDGSGGDGDGGDGSGGDGGGGDGSGGDGGNAEFSFDMSRGDTIYYADGGGMSLDFRSLRILSKSFYVMAESLIYDQRGTVPNPDLPENYCANSAFPHCIHLNTMNCQGEGCPSNAAVACHWESRMSQAEINNAFGAINDLVFLTRTVDSSNPYMADCDNPNLFFYSSVVDDVNVSLANEACVPHGKYYASQGGNNLRSIFNNELDSVENEGEECNNYASYHWQNTKWNYQSGSGFTSALQRSFRNVSYENSRVSMTWKNSGDMTTYCATDVPLIASRQNGSIIYDYMDEFFPPSGLQYRMHKTNSQAADAPTAMISYEADADNGAVRQFFLNEISAVTNRGGAVLNDSPAQTIRDTIELLIQRADQFNYTSTNCP